MNLSSSSPEAEKDGNGKSSALAGLLNKLDLPTIAAVMLFGGSNLFATKDDGRATREEQQKVIRQVDALYNALDDFEKRQRESLNKTTTVLENQNSLLRNQSMMISNQQQFLQKLQHTP